MKNLAFGFTLWMLVAGLGTVGARAQDARESPKEPARGQTRPRFEGETRPGGRVSLLSGVETTGARVRWMQVQGRPVALDDPESPVAHFQMPAASGPLEFVVAVGSPTGLETERVVVPPVSASASALSPSSAGASVSLPAADAGDDQVGLAGHMITLNGSRSQPRDHLAYRWIQTEGPAVSSQTQDGYIYAFVPSAVGHYRFALVVAAEGRISEPDFVEVTVGTAPPARSYAARSPMERTENVSANFTPTYANANGPEAIEALARSAILSIDGAPALAEPVAEAFEGVAARVDLYSTYADVFGEMSMRLNPLIPQDPARRAVWVDRLFTPLTARLVERLRAEGLDLLRADGQSMPLAPEQKAALAEFYRAAASGFRAVAGGIPRP